MANNSLLINKLKQVEGLDKELATLHQQYKKTQNRWLWFHLYIWFPLLQFSMLFLHHFVKDTEKWKDKKDKFPILQLILLVFNGSIFWTFFKGIKKDSLMEIWISHLQNVPSPILIIGCFIVWYALTVVSIRLKITDSHSKFFLWRAYRKWDTNYNWCGSYIESGEIYKDLINDAASSIETGSINVVEAEKFKSAIEKFELLKNALDEKNTLILKQNRIKVQLCDAIIKQGRLGYKHLNVLDMPYIVYKLENGKLVYKDDEDYHIPYQKQISLNSKKNFFVRTLNCKKSCLLDNGRAGYRIKAYDNSIWVIVYQPNHDDDYKLLEKYGIIRSVETKMVLEAIISNLKD